MGKIFSEQEKQSLVARYQSGESVQSLFRETGASKSSFYEWIKRYQGIRSQTGQIVTPQESDRLKRRAEKLENIVRGTPSAAFCKQQRRSRSHGPWMTTSPTQSWRSSCSPASTKAGAGMWSRTTRTSTGNLFPIGDGFGYVLYLENISA